MKILCHVGPWCQEHFAVIGRGIDPQASLVFTSGFQAIDQVGLTKTYYSYVDGASNLAEWSDPRDEEVVTRCRLLRSLDAAAAHRHVRALRRSAREMLRSTRPDIFLCETVDQFFHDVLFQEARSAGIASYGLVQSFVNGYFRLSERGEMNIVREPTNDETEDVRKRLTENDYVPRFLLNAKKSPRLAYLRAMLANLVRIVYFSVRRQSSGEKYNYHYWVSERTPRQLQAHIIPKAELGTSQWKEAIAASVKPTIYIPLQHFPEATIDYWIEDPYFVNYPARLGEVIDRLRQRFHILIKEHPNVWGYRKPSFYKLFEGKADITIVPTNVASQECIGLSDAVLVWTGSVGFEAALRGKPVLSVCTPYYASGSRFMRFDLATPLQDIARFIEETHNTPIDHNEQSLLVKHLLSGLIPGRCQVDGSFSLTSEKDVSDASNIGAAVREVHLARTSSLRRSIPLV